tara:strand:+ start:473 stop:982 length:510 start_codon:yes stop_codon:yes gene_type:complete
MKIQLNKITEYQNKQCILFSKYSVFSSLSEYEKRNQFNEDKIINDIYNGKKAEFLVYNFLISKQKKLASPDLNIYERYNKSYDADLHLKNVNIHVKSHKVNGNFPVSWVFQKKDPLLLEVKNNNYLALVVMNKDINYMYLKNIKDVSFKEPVKESLRNTKLCIYEHDFL